MRRAYSARPRNLNKILQAVSREPWQACEQGAGCPDLCISKLRMPMSRERSVQKDTLKVGGTTRSK